MDNLDLTNVNTWYVTLVTGLVGENFDGIMETSGGFRGIARQTLERKLFRRVYNLRGTRGKLLDKL